MSSYFATTPVRQVSVEGRIIRKDGTVEELGTMAFWHANPLRRFAWRVKQLLRGRKPGRVIQH